MTSTTLRRTSLILVSLGIIVLAVIALLPVIASTHLVRDRIAEKMSDWSGYRVQFGSGPEISVWPKFRATLNKVYFSEWSKPNAAPVLQAERIEIDLSALSALRGDVTFNIVHLWRPVLLVEHDERDQLFVTLPESGKIAQAVAATRKANAQSAEDGTAAELPNDPIGSIDFAEGRILLASDEGREPEPLITDLSGRIDWPSLNRRFSLSSQFKWRDEVLALDLASTMPLMHMADVAAPVSFSLKSPKLSVSFNGTAGLDHDAMTAGALTITSSSFADAYRWLFPDSTDIINIGMLDFSSQISGTLDKLKLDSASLSLDGHSGVGSFELALFEPLPAIAGTFAFDVLDLATLSKAIMPFIPAFAPADLDAEDEPGPISLDMRLSAARAIAGDITISELAATAQVRPDFSAFDISDGSLFGGTLQASIRSDRVENIYQHQLRVTATNIDGQEADTMFALTPFLPAAKGTISIMLRGKGDSLDALLSSADGSVSAKFGPGTFEKFSLAALTSNLEEREFFPFQTIENGQTPILGAELKANLQNGTATLSDTRIETPEHRLELKGIVPFNGGLALVGTLNSTLPLPQISGEDEELPEIPRPQRFFIGGSLHDAYIFPTGKP